MFVAIIGERSRRTTPDDVEFIKRTVESTKGDRPGDTVYLSIGCNTGVGQIVKEVCGSCNRCGKGPQEYRPRYDKARKVTVARNCQNDPACDSVEVLAPFAELSVLLQGFYPAMAGGSHIELYLARNLALRSVGHLFYVFVNNQRNGMVEETVEILRSNLRADQALAVFDENNQLIESYGFEGESNE